MEYYYTQLLMATTFISCLWYYISTKNGGSSSAIPINWPLIGMIPAIISSIHRSADRATEILRQTQGTFMLKGPWFTNTEILLTADEANVLYIMCKRHDAFHKGDNFKEIFSELGDGIFNADDDKWRYQRKIALSALSSTRFRRFMAKAVENKVEKGLIPILDHFLEREEVAVVDLQDLFERLTCDISNILLAGKDPHFLTLELRSHVLLSGGHDAEEAIFLRHIFPKRIWKSQKRLGLGMENKCSMFLDAVDKFFDEIIQEKRENVAKSEDDLLSIYLEENHGATPRELGFKSPDTFLRDTFLNFLLAGQDTVSASLSWYFWLLIKHPRVEAKIREEVTTDTDDNLVYLDATLLEALRLYPVVPFNHKTAKQPETLPSGHQVKPCTIIMVSTYSMGRMKWVWGEDCDEFKPERWIAEQGKTIKQELLQKLFSFNKGPRACLGKEMALVQMKAVACHVLRRNYRFKLVQGHRAEPTSSVVFRMKHGLRVKVMKAA